ncbi:unnamed protein product [Plutella xylostella]|uniref:peptidylamidoglycolate lyase n=1 Tax=Plutella xylostella TaxID=51655 RepID=A0A8S4GDY0_PLUXY|nr:unnamed protein product [Plutella xylostella]
MQFRSIDFIPTEIKVLIVLLSSVTSINCRSYVEPGYYPGYYNRGQENHYAKIQTALEKLDHAPEWIPEWPDRSVNLGQVSAVALDNSGRLVIFHRAANVWDATTFYMDNVYKGITTKPIPEPTLLVFNDTGSIVDKWGQNLFYMPHGLTIDSQGNYWVTDVAMHQVFKFTAGDRTKPQLVLGEKFVPGADETHFCKPSGVAVLGNGDFFVSDGYCNTRVIKFNAEGQRILQWGRDSSDSPYSFNLPHALALAEDKGQVCVADRENGRVACFRTDNGTYVASYKNWLIGPRVFSVAYSPVHGGRLYVVNGPGATVPVRGYVIDFTTGRLIQTFAPQGDFHNPHDVAVSPDGADVYVAEINPYKVYRFSEESLRNESLSKEVVKSDEVVPVKPTATVESSSLAPASWGLWRGAAGGAGGALVAAAVVAAILALLRARNRGRKGAPRRRWEYGHGEFKLRRLLERRRFTRVHSEDSDDEPAPMLPPQPPANA